MEKKYKNQILDILPFHNEKIKNQILESIRIIEIPSKKILLFEGDIAINLFLVLKGCLRTYFIKDNGNEITSQFFIENHMVASFESALTKTPSRQYIDTIEDSIIGIINFDNITKLMNESDTANKYINEYLVSRLIYYMHNRESFILDKPEKRYIKLIKENPGIISRIPQQYIASYLGITPVSLSRIRARLQQINKR